MKWVIRIMPRLRLDAAKDLGIKIRRGRNYVRRTSSHDFYTSQKLADRYKTRRHAELDMEYWFEEVVKLT